MTPSFFLSWIQYVATAIKFGIRNNLIARPKYPMAYPLEMGEFPKQNFVPISDLFYLEALCTYIEIYVNQVV